MFFILKTNKRKKGQPGFDHRTRYGPLTLRWVDRQVRISNQHRAREKKKIWFVVKSGSRVTAPLGNERSAHQIINSHRLTIVVYASTVWENTRIHPRRVDRSFSTCCHVTRFEFNGLREHVVWLNLGSPQALRFVFWESSACGKTGASCKRTRGEAHCPASLWLTPVPRARCCHSKRRAFEQASLNG